MCWGTGNNDAESSVRDSILGRVVGGMEDYAREGDEDEQEPLALLVVHAAMHMLFLPQFTCEFFEENNDADLDGEELDEESRDESRDSMDSDDTGYRRKKKSSTSRNGKNKNQRKKHGDVSDDGEDQEEELTEEEKEAKRLAQIQEEEADLFMKTEAGIKETRYAESGILLLPRPTTVVWAGGIGVKPNKVGKMLHGFTLSYICFVLIVI